MRQKPGGLQVPVHTNEGTISATKTADATRTAPGLWTVVHSSMLLGVIVLALLPSAAAFVAPPLALRQHPAASLQPQTRGAAPPLACVDSESTSSPLASAAAVAGLVANPVMWVSLGFVATTGGGLPAEMGPFVGALEGVSYLVVVVIVGVSAYKKVSTGSGLPAGAGGLLGAAEGLSYLSIAAGVAVLAQLVGQDSCVPNALPLADYSDALPEVTSDKVNVCR